MKILLSLLTALLIASACSTTTDDEIAELRTELQEAETELAELQVDDSNLSDPAQVSTTTTSRSEPDSEISEGSPVSDIDWDLAKTSGGQPGVYLPRHCPEAEPESINNDGFVNYQTTDSFECGPDHLLEVQMHAEVVRDWESSEDLYGVSQYLRIFPVMERNPTTGQFGLWGQWIGDDRAHPHGPFNSIEGGLFIHDKMGRSKFPKYMASAATHLYSSLSDTGGGWGFYERRIPCSVLGRVTLSNQVLVPPNLISFDEDQETYDSEGGIFFGTSWVALPIFGGENREDEQEWGTDGGKLTWTFVADAANYSGPLIAYVPEHWSRRVDRWNAMEILDDIYEWDDSEPAQALKNFVQGDISSEELHQVIQEEWWYTTSPEDEGWEEDKPAWVRPEQTLGFSAASPYLPTGNEMPPIPAFSEIDENGRTFIKMFPPLFPEVNEVEPFVLNVQTFDVNLYNHFVDIFKPEAQLQEVDTSFGNFGIPMTVERWNEEDWREVRYEETEINEWGERDADLFISAPFRPRHDNGETNIFFEWEGVAPENRGWDQYLEMIGTEIIPVAIEEVPASLIELEYESQPHTTSLAPHVETEAIYYDEDYIPDYSCWVCEDTEVCDPTTFETVTDDGSKISYRWYRFRDQPLFRDLAVDYPEIYSDSYLNEIQEMIETMHQHWGGSQQFIERPNSQDELHLAEIDHGLLVEPPTGKEIGWVPVATQVEQPDGIWQLEIDVRETPIGRLVR